MLSCISSIFMLFSPYRSGGLTLIRTYVSIKTKNKNVTFRWIFNGLKGKIFAFLISFGLDSIEMWIPIK